MAGINPGRSEHNTTLIINGQSGQAVQAIGAVGKALGETSNLAEKTARSMKLFAMSIVGGRIGRGMEDMGRALLDISKNMTDSAIAFDKGQRLIRTQVSMSGRKFRAFNDDVLNMAKTLPLPMEQIQEGLYDVMSSMDVNARQAIRLTKQFAQAAVAGNTDIRSTTRAAVGALNAFDLPLKDTNKVLDIQFQLVKYGVGTYEEFINVLGEVYPSAVAAEQSLGEIGGALSFTTRNGLDASKAGISVARALDMITRPNYAAKIKENLGIDVVDQATGKYKSITRIMEEFSDELGHLTKPEQRAALADIFGAGEIRANRFFLMALNNTEELSNMTSRFADKTVKGALGDAYKMMAGALGNQIEKVKNHLIVIGTTLGKTFFPIIRDALKFFERLLNIFEDLPEPTKRLVAQVILLGGAFLLVGGKLVSFLATLAGAQSIMIMAGMTWGGMVKSIIASGAKLMGTVAVLAAIGFAIYEVIQNFDDIKAAFSGFTDFWKRNWDDIVYWTTVAVGGIATMMLVFSDIGVISGTRGMMGGLRSLQGGFNTLRGAIGRVISSVGVMKAVTAGAALGGAMAVKNFAGSFRDANEWADKLVDGLDGSAGSFKTFEANVRSTFEASGNFRTKVSDAFRTVAAGGSTATQKINSLLGSVERLEESAESLTATGRMIALSKAAYIEATVRAQQAIDEFGHGAWETTNALQWLESAERGLTDAMKQQVIATMEEAAANETLIQTRQRLAGLADTLLGSELDLRDARRRLADATERVRELEEQGITKGREYNQAVDDQKRAELGLREARRRNSQTLQELTAALEGAATEGKTSERAFKILGETFGITKKQSEKLIEDFATGTQTLQELADKYDINRKTLRALHPALEVLHDDLAANSQQSQILRDKMENIPNKVITNIYASTREADRVVNDWVARLKSMKVNVTVGARVPGTQLLLHSGGNVPGGGDVPAVLQGGEYVVNRKRADQFRPVLEAMNSGPAESIRQMFRAVAEKFHNGGSVGTPRVNYDLSAIGGAMTKAASSKMSTSIAAIGRVIQNMGFLVGEHPLFGGVAGVHAPNSYHYLGRALDINWPGGGGAETARLSALYAWIQRHVAGVKELLWQVPGHFTHLHMAMANGGTINEPVFGVGRSGRTYSFGERGSETVIPNRPQRSGVSATEKHLHFHTVGKLDTAMVKQTLDEYEWLERTRGW